MNVLEQFSKIKTFVFDMDGVLTDGSLTLLPDGAMCRRMNIKDGYALQLAVKKQYNIVVISGGTSPESEMRLRKLGITNIFMQVPDKATLLKEFLEEKKILSEQVLFMGDDVPDFNAMQIVGLPCCPTDAAIEIKEIAHYISPLKGGEGCVRDVIEKVLKLQHNWKDDFFIQSK
ncbi:MAG TPA: HAD hydrolase family protein [Chitinophagaceae bacterium]|nr:HAD hydrolase family protein [Chitinophagaceae bacterium]MCC6635349.1 HAD hydrolase family protein [Chitinophagaceae bacterium]HNE92693.1 HAD hydrolase family protein [Chitinophagaceae bacterium]HNF29079.1 HAD hydrolase family protein [Chitinophagaceae bacterium]HNJ58712.1 HAD hydrolase family protein [Chitinophagaceae bacterium]